jgi:hypothetical protein
MSNEPKDLKISFTDSPEEEVALIQRELGLSDVADQLERALIHGEALPEEVQLMMAQIVTGLQEMFSLDLPSLGETPEETLRLSSRDINLSRLLRERGLIRIYRLVNESNNGVPLFMTYLDPYNDEPFSRKEDFIGWVAKDAHIPRSTMFMRFSTYDKMLAIGFDLETAFQTVITKPYAMREVLKLAAEWDKGSLVNVNPEVVKNIAEQVYSEADREELIELADQYTDDSSPVNLQKLVNAYKPALREFIGELAEHTNTKDMMEYVRHDVLDKPEISYSWKNEALILHVVRKAVDEDGTEIVIDVEDIPFVPDYPGIIEEDIVDDLLDRLPIRNRREVLNEREKRALKGNEEVPYLPF